MMVHYATLGATAALVIVLGAFGLWMGGALHFTEEAMRRDARRISLALVVIAIVIFIACAAYGAMKELI